MLEFANASFARGSSFQLPRTICLSLCLSRFIAIHPSFAWSSDFLLLTLHHSSPFPFSIHPAYDTSYIQHTLYLWHFTMHPHQLLIILAIIAGLAYSLHGPIEINNAIEEPAENQDQPESLRLQLRGVTKQLDYKCGPKYGTCPSGTCCSSAGE